MKKKEAVNYSGLTETQFDNIIERYMCIIEKDKSGDYNFSKRDIKSVMRIAKMKSWGMKKNDILGAEAGEIDISYLLGTAIKEQERKLLAMKKLQQEINEARRFIYLEHPELIFLLDNKFDLSVFSDFVINYPFVFLESDFFIGNQGGA